MNDPLLDKSDLGRDVRMRGFVKRTPVREVQQWIDRHAGVLPSESVPVTASAGRVLADDVVSQVDVPGFDRGMMDGYAVQAADTEGAAPYNPLELSVIGTSMPGRAFTGVVGSGQAVRIMTGAPVPEGADAVIPAEKTESAPPFRTVRILAPIPEGKHVGLRGEDIGRGTTLLRPGRRLRPQDVGLLCSVGIGRVSVVRRPRVRVIITGDELLPPGAVPRDYKIVDSNGPMLRALLERDGALVTDDHIVADQPEAISQAMQDDVDLVVVSGGSSVGLEDHAPRILRQLGELAIHGIAIRPSSPAGMGRLDNRLVFLLPGNPVSCLCAYDFFAGRAVRLLGGRQAAWPYLRARLPLRRKIASQIGRVDYARVRIEGDQVVPLAISGASLLSSTSAADGFVVIDEQSEGHAPGDVVTVFLYDLPD